MADVAKVMGIDIANVAKVMGLANVAKIMGYDWPSGYEYLTTQIDSGAIKNQGTDPDGLSALPLATVEVTSPTVIAEDPVGDTLNLSSLTMSTVEAGTGLAYKLTYSGNGNDGGTAPTDATWYPHGTDATVAGAGTLTLTDHSFDGWNTESDGSGTAYAPEDDITMNAPTTLYAQWVED